MPCPGLVGRAAPWHDRSRRGRQPQGPRSARHPLRRRGNFQRCGACRLTIWGVSLTGGSSIAGLFIMENPMKMDDLGVAPFWETHGNPHLWNIESLKINAIYSLVYTSTSSTTQGGGRNLKDRKPIVEACCCDTWVPERTHWRIDNWLECRCWTAWQTGCLPCYFSICHVDLLDQFTCTSIVLFVYLFIWRSICLSTCLAYLPFHLPIYLFI